MGKGRIEEGERAQWGEDEVRMEGRGQWEDNEGWMRQWKGERTAGGKRRAVRGREGEENERVEENTGERKVGEKGMIVEGKKIMQGKIFGLLFRCVLGNCEKLLFASHPLKSDNTIHGYNQSIPKHTMQFKGKDTRVDSPIPAMR